MCWGCENPDGDYLAEVVRPIIERSGWMVQYVEPEGACAALAYTVGLTSCGLPELVATGLGAQDSAELLNAAATLLHSRCLHAGERVTVCRRRVEVVRIPVPEAHLFTAVELYGPRLEARQLVHADDRGVWPWHGEYRRGRGGQPVLGPRSRRAS